MSKGILITVSLIAGCVYLAQMGLSRQIRAAQELGESMATTPPWSPFIRMPDVIPDLGRFGPLSHFEAEPPAAA